MSYKTVSLNEKTAKKEWVVIDATDMVVGRLSTQVAMILRGKNKPSFTPHVDCGDNVVIINAGKVRALGVASTKRSPALPDVPTFIEAGVPFEGDSWLALMGPPGIPDDVTAKLNQEIAATLNEPETKERLAKIGLEFVASSPAGLTEVLQRDVLKWGKAVKDSGAVAD